MSTQAQLATQIQGLSSQLKKIGRESADTLRLVEELKVVVANQEQVSPELQAAVDALAEQVKAVDDLVPDATVTPPTETPSEENPAT